MISISVIIIISILGTCCIIETMCNMPEVCKEINEEGDPYP